MLFQNGAINDKVIFKCDNCGKEMLFKEVMLNVALYGILFLFGNEDAYLGITCDKCKTTTIKQDDKENVKSLKDQINKIGELMGIEHILRYYAPESSFLYFEEKDKARYCSPHTFFPLDHPTGLDITQFVEYMVPRKDHLAEYISYFYGDKALGHTMTLMWFKGEVIEEALEEENRTRIKVFPRYRFYDRFVEHVDAFCWNHHTKFKYLNWFKELCQGLSVEIKIMESIDSKLEYLKKHDFLEILEESPECSSPMVPSSFARLINLSESEDNIFPSLTEKQRNVLTKCWDNFASKEVQEALSILANRFIYEYLELVEKVACTPASIWSLRERYLDELAEYLGSSSGRKRVRRRVPNAELREVGEAEKTFPSVKIISQDSRINRLKIDISKLAPYQRGTIDFLLIGETGTGKELFARAIHEASNRKGKFIPVNCSSIPEDLFEGEFYGHVKGAFTGAENDKKGYFEKANGGTIFLDEIGELAMRFQPRLLRVIQEREIHPVGAGEPKKIDVKMVFATNRDLKEMVKNNEFRADLLNRINGFTFTIPPLRERKEDIPILVRHFLDKYDSAKEEDPKLAPMEFTDEFIKALMDLRWEGNVRELENCIRKIVVKRVVEKNREPLAVSDLQDRLEGRVGRKAKLATKTLKLPGNTKVTTEQVREAMREANNNKSEAARMLGVSYKTVQRHCQKMSRSL